MLADIIISKNKRGLLRCSFAEKGFSRTSRYSSSNHVWLSRIFNNLWPKMGALRSYSFMRKFITTIILITLLPLISYSRQITQSEAYQVALEFFNSLDEEDSSQKDYHGSLKHVKAGYTQSNLSTLPFYIFNRNNGNGFVIISGNDCVSKVLGYAEKGNIDNNNIPPQLSVLLNQYSSQISTVSNGSDIDSSWLKENKEIAEPEILLNTVNWGQDSPYNLQCPKIDDVSCPTGCVATAMAIAMQYHNWPKRTQGLEYVNFNNVSQSFDFSNYCIDWTSLNDSKCANFDIEVSRLMSSLGVITNMMYTREESSAEVWPIGHMLSEIYSYSPECQFIERNKFSDEKWRILIHEQLEQNLPIIYSAFDEELSGHSFIVDGVNSEGLYHINWGWNGISNGFFSLDSFGNYSINHSMIINIRPDYNTKKYSRCFISNADIYENELIQYNVWNFSSSSFEPNKEYELISPIIALPSDTQQFFLNLAVVNNEDEIVEIVGNSELYIIAQNEGRCAHPGCRVEMSFITPDYNFSDDLRFQLVSKEVNINWNEFFSDTELNSMWKDKNNYELVNGGIVLPSFFQHYGNTSEIVKITYHTDSKKPYRFEFEANERQGLREDYFTRRLKGSGAARNIIMSPLDDLNIRIEGKDKNGNAIDPVYNFLKSYDGYSFNISLYGDEYDVYFDYCETSDSKHALSNMDVDKMITINGLVYYVENGEASIIGYDSVENEFIEIPSHINFNNDRIPVTMLCDNALLHHPAKALTLGPNIRSVGRLSIADMPFLTDFSFPDYDNVADDLYFNLFCSEFTSLENIYIPNEYFVKYCWIPNVFYSQWRQLDRDVNIYMSDIQDSGSAINELIEQFNVSSGNSSLTVPRIYVPGLNYLSSHMKQCQLPEVIEMYQYNIYANYIEVIPLIENLEIESITVNGTLLNHNEDNRYYYDCNHAPSLDVHVDYRINKRWGMSSHYDNNFNMPITDAINDIEDESTLSGGLHENVFNLQGLIMNNSSNLNPGIYICRKGSIVKKFIVK